MNHRLEFFWKEHVYQNRHPWLGIILVPLSLLYRSGTAIKKLCTRLPGIGIDPVTPVVCIGNLSVGGSGKTPLCHYLIAELRQRNLSVRLVSRGYGARFEGALARRRNQSWDTEGFFGDEVEMTVRRFPDLEISVGRQRALFAREADQEKYTGILLYDDALQYWRMGRNFNLVVFHWGLQLGNGRIFPAGPLREGPGALKRAGGLVITHAPPELRPEEVRRKLAYEGPVFFLDTSLSHFEDLHAGRVSVNAGTAIHALAAIANPQDFFADLQNLGLRILKRYALSDHEDQSRVEQQRILDTLPGDGFLVMTEKDRPRWKIEDPRVLCAIQKADVREGAQDLLHLIISSGGEIKSRSRES